MSPTAASPAQHTFVYRRRPLDVNLRGKSGHPAAGSPGTEVHGGNCDLRNDITLE